VNYCNLGTEEATGTYIEVTLDSFFTDVSSSIPWSSVDGRTYTFDIGTVPIGVCGSFYIEFTIDCDAEFGQTHCSEAYIFPEPPCTPVAPLYGGGEIEVTAECTSADVIFTMTNHGDPLTEPVEYIVIEDIMIQMSDQFTPLLGTGETHTVTVPANGSTWRLMSNEVSDHPFETIATTAVEGCGVDSTGSFSLGFINMYPLSDEEPFMDEDCQENIGSYDPNDKTGYPLGYEDEHFIERGQDLDYRIRFQNTGTDTAFSVVIIDTLPAELDPGSLRIQGFSHPMTYDLIGEGVVVFRFADIMLPDSNVNEPASHGFVKFTIDQQPGLEIGTTIENEASIYFDFNEQIITNLTLHTIGEPIFEVEVTSTTVQIPNVNLNVYPNPFDTEANFDFNGHDLEEGTIRIFDVQGKMVKSQSFTGSQFKMDGSSLTEGFYFFQITDTGRNVASGKLMVK
jgi:uncharacterized repeat protein (TIGR01451 family)